MKPKDYEIRCAAAEAGIVAWVDVEGDSVLADATVRMVEILTSKGILTLTSPQASAASQPAAVVELTDAEIIAEYELEMQQSLRGHEKANVIRVCRKAIAAHIAKQSGGVA